MADEKKPRRPTLPKEEREKRDALILNLFLSGWSEREIARHQRINLTNGRVHQIIVIELDKAAKRFGLISEKALIVYSERLEMLIRAIWPKATGSEKDAKSIEVARRLLAQQSQLYQLSSEGLGMPLPPMGDNELSEDVVELQEYRNRHRKPPETAG
jgi:hypothetical protein